MIWTENWLAFVLQLFDHTLDALLGNAFFSMLFELLVLLLAISLLSSMIRAGRKL